MNNGNKKNFPYDSNSQSSNLNENAIPDNTINYQVKDNIDMKNFIEENNNKDTIRQISASNDFCIICEVKKQHKNLKISLINKINYYKGIRTTSKFQRNYTKTFK